jgi:hypothetical protein
MRDVPQRSLQAGRVAPRERDAEGDVVIKRRGAFVNVSGRRRGPAVVQHEGGRGDGDQVQECDEPFHHVFC